MLQNKEEYVSQKNNNLQQYQNFIGFYKLATEVFMPKLLASLENRRITMYNAISRRNFQNHWYQSQVGGPWKKLTSTAFFVVKQKTIADFFLNIVDWSRCLCCISDLKRNFKIPIFVQLGNHELIWNEEDNSKVGLFLVFKKLTTNRKWHHF